MHRRLSILNLRLTNFSQRYLIAGQHWQKEGGFILSYTDSGQSFIERQDIIVVKSESFSQLIKFEFWFCHYPVQLWDSRHLNFLTSEQALADFGELIKHLKRTIPGTENHPVISLGGSYGGMLAVWFRMKYPHMVAG
ncbi:lysosomal Pro-X carboxypeptidase-like [Phyllostomus hastatus]|uniref:lysosomal Pro-X carboxypeptidase-like n=1 Tax=Phyllostomus hastatus TaxID=9423 RepID=UPI001E6812FF|nr:lysosomal Pro-X carboxypeptidase-like [Phyllostomus hastatus]